MDSFGGEETMTKKAAMWLYPKALGHIPPKRWGHSACFSHSHGLLYIFGGCCGGLHYSDVQTLNLRTMSWTTLATTGRCPGPRDSHTAVLVGNKMVVFGGTNGSQKVNDLHILDLASREWSQPNCLGDPPSPRESHTATLLGGDKMVIFGGSGEGEGNYLNDLHVLDIGTMRWSSLENAKGDSPVPRDSHSAVTIANKLVVYGGDCGDRYHGDVDIFDMDTSTWSRLAVQGRSPGVRAGHASVTIGSKVYVIGGVGDRHYYNDAWVLDIMSGGGSWTRLDICGQQPQGRFSHAAAVVTTGADIAIYGGCGEDERPLNEVLVLQLGTDDPNGPYNISMCKLFSNAHWNKEKRRYLRGGGEDIRELQSFRFSSDTLRPKRRRMSSSKVWDVESDQEEHSLSVSPQHSSRSQSDQERMAIRKLPETSTGFHFFRQLRQSPNGSPLFIRQAQEQCREAAAATATCLGPQNVQHGPKLQPRASDSKTFQNLIGADVWGKVDGAFDSGLLMTAAVNGKIFRGVLFSPEPVVSRPLPATRPVVVAQPVVKRGDQPSSLAVKHFPAGKESPEKLRNDLQGVVLTLAGPGDSHT